MGQVVIRYWKKPIIEKIDSAPFGIKIDRKEKKWIKYYRNQPKTIADITNISDGGHNGGISESQKKILSEIGRKSRMKVPILQYSLSGNFIKEFNGIREVSRITTLQWNHIVACCKRKRSYTEGYQWRYKTGGYPLKIKPIEKMYGKRKVIQMDLEGNEIRKFNSIMDAARGTNTNRKSIENCCKGKYHTGGGHKWKYIKITD